MKQKWEEIWKEVNLLRANVEHLMNDPQNFCRLRSIKGYYENISHDDPMTFAADIRKNCDFDFWIRFIDSSCSKPIQSTDGRLNYRDFDDQVAKMPMTTLRTPSGKIVYFYTEELDDFFEFKKTNFYREHRTEDYDPIEPDDVWIHSGDFRFAMGHLENGEHLKASGWKDTCHFNDQGQLVYYPSDVPVIITKQMMTATWTVIKHV